MIVEVLAYASVVFTMDVYSHIIEGTQNEAVALLDGVLPAGVSGMHQRGNAIVSSNCEELGKNASVAQW